MNNEYETEQRSIRVDDAQWFYDNHRLTTLCDGDSRTVEIVNGED